MIDLDYYNPLTQQILGAAFEVHRVLGFGYLESVYQKAMEHELGLRGIPFQSQARIDVRYKKILAGYYVPDLLVFEDIIVELKAQEKVDLEAMQTIMINHMVCLESEVSLMLNFGLPSLEHKRYLIPRKHQ